MLLQDHLEARAKSSRLTCSERQHQDRVIKLIGCRVEEFFALRSGQHFPFGSVTRDTNLPRSLDPQVDIDYLVLFPNPCLTPSYYRDRLQDFVKSQFRKSDLVEQSRSVVIELDGFRIDFVPALRDLHHEFLIPSTGAHGETVWTRTNERHLHVAECWEDVRCNNSLKPVIRLLKQWNASAGYVYRPFELETAVTYQNHVGCKGIKDLFCRCINQLEPPLQSEPWRRQAVNRIKMLANSALRREQSHRPMAALAEMQSIIP